MRERRPPVIGGSCCKDPRHFRGAAGRFVTAFCFGHVLANITGGFFVDYVGGRYALALALLPPGAATFCFS
jgi:hypothetical protein